MPLSLKIKEKLMETFKDGIIKCHYCFRKNPIDDCMDDDITYDLKNNLYCHNCYWFNRSIDLDDGRKDKIKNKSMDLMDIINIYGTWQGLKNMMIIKPRNI